MNGKPPSRRPEWTGIAPTPKVFEQLDYEEAVVLGLLAWASASKRQIFAADVAALPDRDGRPMGLNEAKEITRRLSGLKILSVLGMTNDRPLSVFMGGFQAAPKRSGFPGARPAPGIPTPGRPAPASPVPQEKPTYVTAKPGQIVENKTGGLPDLKTTPYTPAWVQAENQRLRIAQRKVEQGEFEGNLVEAAVERKRIVEARIALYERWLGTEKGHPFLPKYLERKRSALPELEYQLERAKVKQAELEAGGEGE